MKIFLKIIGVIFSIVIIVAVIAFFVVANGDIKGTAKALSHRKVPLSLFYSYAGRGNTNNEIIGVIEKVDKDIIYIKTQKGEFKKINLFLYKTVPNPRGNSIEITEPFIVYVAEKERPDMIKYDEREKRFKLLKTGMAVIVNLTGGSISINKSVYTD